MFGFFYIYDDSNDFVNLCSVCSGKTLLAKAVANQTSATFLRVVGSELIQKYLVIVTCAYTQFSIYLSSCHHTVKIQEK